MHNYYLLEARESTLNTSSMIIKFYLFYYEDCILIGNTISSAYKLEQNIHVLLGLPPASMIGTADTYP